MRERILVTGAKGLVGSHFVESFDNPNYDLLCPSRRELDISSPKAVKRFFEESEPKVVIHFAAFTDVGAAEKERGDESGPAWSVNVLGTENLVKACVDQKAYLVHISTDVVFSCRQNDPGPYDEDCPLETDSDKLSWYGWTKARGELIVAKELPSSAIVRIANPTRAQYEAKLDYVRKIVFLFDEGRLYPMFTDQHLTITFIDEVSEAVARLIDQSRPGVYHVSSRNMFTPFELANYLLERARGVKGVVRQASIEAYLQQGENSARYPHFGGLKTEKSQKKLGIKFRTWEEIIDTLY